MAAAVYIVIIAMWAAVLIPVWLRRHDDSRSLKSVDTFKRALTTLADDPRMAQMLPTPVAMHRRRKVYAALLGLFVLVLVLWAAGVSPGWTLLIPTTLVTAFSVAARKQVREETRQREAAVRYLRARARSMAAHPTRKDSIGLVRPNVREQAPPASTQAAPAARAAVRSDDGITAAASSWQPQPITLPTYVSAPAATAIPRNIDVANQGGWSAEQMLQQAAQNRTDASDQQPDLIDLLMEHATRHGADEVFDQSAYDDIPYGDIPYGDIPRAAFG